MGVTAAVIPATLRTVSMLGLLSSALGAWDTFPVKSINLADHPSIESNVKLEGSTTNRV